MSSTVDDSTDVLEQIPGETKPQRLARAARLMAGCSIVVDPARFVRTVIRPVDRTGQMHAAYFANPKMSTCELAQCAACRMAGVADAEVTGHEPLDGGISARIQRLCNRYGAWCPITATMSAEQVAGFLRQGRGWWIDDGSGFKVHAGTCVGDARVVNASSVDVDDVEGGQWKVNDNDPDEHPIGDTAQRAFTRHLARDPKTGLWMMGARHLIAVQCFDLLPFDVTPEAATGEIVTPNAGPETAPTGDA